MAFNIGQNGRREQTVPFRARIRPLRDAIPDQCGRDIDGRNGLDEDGARRPRQQDSRIVDQPVAPDGKQWRGQPGLQVHAGPLDDDKMREVEQFAPAVPGRQPAKQ